MAKGARKQLGGKKIDQLFGNRKKVPDGRQMLREWGQSAKKNSRTWGEGKPKGERDLLGKTNLH